MKYPKINTIWKRDEKTHKIIEGDYSCTEFKNIKEWYVTEKIDGTNVRVIIEFINDSVISENKENGYVNHLEFKGKTDEAMLPLHLKNYLYQTFLPINIRKALEYNGKYPSKVIIYGEGYGNKIQDGHKKYREDVSFICFDIWIDGLWLEPETIKDICKKIGIDYVPEIPYFNSEGIVEAVRKGFPSAIGLNPQIQAEGVVCRPKPLMLFRNGNPIIWKLKCKDFR